MERTEVNIWEDSAGAAVVRTHARGHETVPTVVIGGVGLVNPSADEVIRALSAHGLDAPEGSASGAAGRTSGLVWGAAATGLWILLALAHPTRTYHLAPLVAAVAWPLIARAGRRRTGWAPGLVAAGGSAALVAIATAVLTAASALDGPALVGGSALAETAVMGGLGLAIAVGMAVPSRVEAAAGRPGPD